MEFAPLQPVDRISNLPENVIADILMCLPTRDAASTSILSKQWRYKWVKLPHLIFDVTVWQELEVDERTMRFFLFLYEVLLRHQGPITKFSLVIPRLKSCSHIDHVINFLSNYGVEEFIFEIYKGYRIPSSLFMYLQLKRLTLSACLINPPPAFKGFNRLVRMELCDVIIDAEVLQSLISSCLLLEQLLLDFRNEFDFLEIDAPMLRLFHLRRFFCSSICIKRSQHLATVRVTSRQHIMADEFNYGNCNFVGFFDSLPALHKLCMDFHFMLVQKVLPTTLINLKILKLLRISLYSEDEFSCVLCLIRSSPNLEKMTINAISGWENTVASPVPDFLKVQEYSDVLLNQLQEVKLESISVGVSEMTLIKLLLDKSLKLKRMVIRQESGWYRPSIERVNVILKEINKFRRASPSAKVIYEN